VQRYVSVEMFFERDIHGASVVISYGVAVARRS
jgi:hypothetical protein